MLEEADRTTNESEMRSMLMKIQEIIYSEATHLFLFRMIKCYGLQKRVSGFVPYADGLLRLNHVYLKN